MSLIKFYYAQNKRKGSSSFDVIVGLITICFYVKGPKRKLEAIFCPNVYIGFSFIDAFQEYIANLMVPIFAIIWTILRLFKYRELSGKLICLRAWRGNSLCTHPLTVEVYIVQQNNGWSQTRVEYLGELRRRRSRISLCQDLKSFYLEIYELPVWTY